jgi:'Paired box' domain
MTLKVSRWCNFNTNTVVINKSVVDHSGGRLISDGVCDQQNIPSISSINRIIRDKSLYMDTKKDLLNSEEVSFSVGFTSIDDWNTNRILVLFLVSYGILLMCLCLFVVLI